MGPLQVGALIPFYVTLLPSIQYSNCFIFSSWLYIQLGLVAAFIYTQLRDPQPCIALILINLVAHFGYFLIFYT